MKQPPQIDFSSSIANTVDITLCVYILTPLPHTTCNINIQYLATISAVVLVVGVLKLGLYSVYLLHITALLT